MTNILLHPNDYSRENIVFATCVILLFLISSSFTLYEAFHKKTCVEFATWSQAQEAMVDNPARYGGLDRDKDGFACDTKIKNLLYKK